MTKEEAIEIVKSNWPEGRHQIKEALETLIPELVESEDEKTRREIISFIEWADSRGSIPSNWHQAKRPAVWLAYLEGQKEREYQLYESTKDRFYREGVKDGILIGKDEAQKQNSAEYIKRNSKEWHDLLSEQYDKGYLRGKSEQESRTNWRNVEIQGARMILPPPPRGLMLV